MKESNVARFANPDPDFEDESYHDDPTEQVSPKPRLGKNQTLLASILILIGGTFFLQTSLAGNINLNGSGQIEYGQGISQLTACSGGTSLRIVPTASFANASGSGSFYFSSFTVSNIPAGCNSAVFTLNAYGPSSNTALSLFDTSVANAIINDNSGTYSSGSGSSLSVVTNSSSSFTATFSNPVALGSSVAKLVLQSSANVIPAYNSIQVSTSTNLTFAPGISPGTGSFTIEAWLKTGSSIHAGPIIGNSNSGAGLSFILDGSTEVHIDGYGRNAYHYVLPVTLQPNTWYHIAIARDASLADPLENETVWINGARSTSAYVTNGSPNGTGIIRDPINYDGRAIGINVAECYWCVPGNSTLNGERLSNIRFVVGRALYNPTSTTITVPTMPLANVAGTQLLLLFSSSATITTDTSGNQTVTNNGTTYVAGQ